MPAPLAASKWLSCPRPDPAAPMRLWCLPFAGGGAAVWHPWAARLAGSAEIVGVRLPGRENRIAERPVSEFEPLVAAIADELAPHVHERDVLCGHSLGAILAFEVARELRARRLPGPAGLVVAGARAPHLPRTEPDLRHLPDDNFVAQVDRRYGGIPPTVRENREFLDLFLPALRADLTIFETYRHTAAPALAVPLLALGGSDDLHVSRAQVLAWGAHTTGIFSVDFFRGGHFFPQGQVDAVTARVGDFLHSF